MEMMKVMNSDNTKLIYGKNNIQGIVSIEIKDDLIEVFQQNDEGAIDVTTLPNKFWLLAKKPLDKRNWIRLDGDLHYKYGLQFESREEFLSARGRFKKSDTFSIFGAKEAAMAKDGLTYFKGMKPQDVSVLSFDIEAYGLLEAEQHQVYMITNTFRSQGKITKKMFSLDEYDDDEYKMLVEWCAWVREMNPSVMIGHNIYAYDFPYLQTCADKYNYTLQLGRDDSDITFNTYTSYFRVDGSQKWSFNECQIYGREIVDTQFLAVKHDLGRNFPSWGLKSIVEHLGLMKEGRQFYDAGTIRHNWHKPEEREKIKQYGIDDADDSLALYDIMIPTWFYLTQSIPMRFSNMINKATGSQMNSLMIRAYLQDKHSLPNATEAERYEGAISLGNPGVHHNVVKWDLAALYPSIMRQYNVYDKKKDPKQIFSKLVEYFTQERLANKKLAAETGDPYYSHMEQSQKVCNNSFYGFMGAPGLLFNSPENAALVTKIGRDILKKGIKWASGQEVIQVEEKGKTRYKLDGEIAGKGFQIVNVDTDSFSFTDRGRLIADDENGMLLEVLNSMYPDLIIWERDGEYETVLVVATKNYALYDGKKVTIKGSSLKATTKEPALKLMISEAINSLLGLREETFDAIYHRYCKEAFNIKDITRWGSKKSVTPAVLKSPRTNEIKIRAAITGEGLSIGDKFFAFFKEDDSLCLTKNFDGDYSKRRMLEKVFKTAKIFESVYDVKSKLYNYTLKRNKDVLLELVG
jgi:DNA polymerase elongation subunit (family B)